MAQQLFHSKSLLYLHDFYFLILMFAESISKHNIIDRYDR